MESIKLNVTKEFRMSWQVRLHLHTCQSLSMCVKIPLQSTGLKIHLLLYTNCVKLVKNLWSRFVKNDSFMKQMKLQPKKEIIQAINQEEKCKVYYSYIYIPDTLFILYTHQYLLCFNFWKPVPKIPHSALL